MARAIWKGAISFGLVHIPVSLVTATTSENINFDWLDERTMDRVGYQRINKVTGKVIDSEHVVKGVEYEKDTYVVLSEDEIKGALPKATQTIDIFGFVDRQEIPLLNFYKPYFLSPGRRGEKVYALLRESLVKSDKVALACLVIHTRQRLAAVLPMDSALVIMLLRWPSEVKKLDSLSLHEDAVDPDLSAKELSMAGKLIEEMTTPWEEENYRNTFDERIMELVEQKAKAGKLEAVRDEDADAAPRKTADVIDLTELLKRSLGSRGSAAKKETSENKAPAKKTGPKTTSTSPRAKKTARK